MSKEKKENEVIGIYDGENVDVEDVVQDMSNFSDAKQHEELIEKGYIFVGSTDKDSTQEEIDDIADKVVRMSTIVQMKKLGMDPSILDEDEE